MIERMRVLGAGLSINTPEEFTAYIARDYERMAKLSGIGSASRLPALP